MSSDKETINELRGMLDGAREEIAELEMNMEIALATLHTISKDRVVNVSGEVSKHLTWAAELAAKTLAKLKGDLC